MTKQITKNSPNNYGTPNRTNRRGFLQSSLLGGAAAAAYPALAAPRVAAQTAPSSNSAPKDFELDELTINDLQETLGRPRS